MALSIADIYTMPDDGNRYELLEGEIFAQPVSTPEHQGVAGALARMIGPRLSPGYELFPARVGLVLADGQFAEPDVVVVPVANVRELWLVAPALLVVEVTSPRTRGRDYVLKRNVYAASGVEHYWIVDMQADRFVAQRLNPERGQYDVVVDRTGGVVEVADPVAISFTLKGLV